MKFLRKFFKTVAIESDDKLDNLLYEALLENNILYKALSICGHELYKHTGKNDHIDNEYWIKIVKDNLK